MCKSNSKPSYSQWIVILNGLITLSDRIRSGEQNPRERFQFNGYVGPHSIVRHVERYRSPKDIIDSRTVDSMSKQGFVRKNESGCKNAPFELTVKSLDFLLQRHGNLATRFPECEAAIMELVMERSESVRLFLCRWERTNVKGSITPTVMFNEAKNWTYDLREMFILPNPFDLLKPNPDVRWPNKIPGMEVSVWYRNNLKSTQFKVIHLLRFHGEPICIFVQEGENTSYYNEFILNREIFLKAAFRVLEATFGKNSGMEMNDRIGNIPAFPRSITRAKNDGEFFYSWNDIDLMRRDRDD